MHPELEAAIEAMYGAFARPRPREVNGCPCCTTPEELRALMETPLRELGDEQLARYASSVLLTVGDVDDLRYFWPRIVDLTARGELSIDCEIVFGKPPLGDWRRWPQAEQDAIEGFVRAQMGDMARREYESFDVDAWICAFGRLMEDVVPYLAPLLEPTAAAGANLLGLYSFNAEELAQGKLGDPFWTGAPGNATRVAAWLGGEAVAAALSAYRASQPVEP
jgi:hypothetical protein